MYSRHIEVAIALHPRHRAELTAAMQRGDTLERAIRLIKAVCERCSIGEFPNPFPRSDERDPNPENPYHARGLWFAIWQGWERGREPTKAERNMMRDHMAYDAPPMPSTAAEPELPPSPEPPAYTDEVSPPGTVMSDEARLSGAPEPTPYTLRRPKWDNKKRFPNKEAIETWVLSEFGVDLDTKKLTREAMIEEANRLIRAEQRKPRK